MDEPSTVGAVGAFQALSSSPFISSHRRRSEGPRARAHLTRVPHLATSTSGNLLNEPRLFPDGSVELGKSFSTLVLDLQSEVPLGA